MVSIIILSYNTKILLKECLRSIFSKLSSIPFEVIVLDNDSKDESVAMVKKDFPKVQVIESEENLGFAKGVNTAAKKAQGEYLLFLNSDATLLDGNTAKMLDIFRKEPDVGVIGGNLLNKDGTTSEAYGQFYMLPEVFRFLFFANKTIPRVDRPVTQVDWVSGGFLLIRKSLFEKIGGFDEHFFMYIEDMEMCFRIMKKGSKVVYYRDAEARHVGQGSSNRAFAIVNIFKGIKYFYKKHRPLYEYYVVQLLLLLKALSAYSIGLCTGNQFLRSTYAQALRVIL